MKIKFEPRDIWIGLYWTPSRITTLDTDTNRITFYLCIIPLLPIIWTWDRKIHPKNRHKNW